VGALQVPQYLFEAATEAGEAGQCNIICTQPRRIAAISVAERVANERGDSPPGTPGQQSLICLAQLLVCLSLCSVLHCMRMEHAEQSGYFSTLVDAAEHVSPSKQPQHLISSVPNDVPRLG